MKKIYLLLSLMIVCGVNAQQLPDSFLVKYDALKSPDEKGEFIIRYVNKISDYNVRMKEAVKFFNYFKKQGDEVGMDYAEYNIGSSLSFSGDYASGLNKYYEILARFINRKDTSGVLTTYNGIAMSYDDSKNYVEAIATLKKALPLATIENSNDYSLSYFYWYLSTLYSHTALPDSGIAYAQKAITIDEYKGNYNLSFDYCSLAENYIAKEEFEIALPFLRKALHIMLEKNNKNNNFAFLYNDFAQLFLGKKLHDSTYFYAQLALKAATRSGWKQEQAKAYEHLYKSFDLINKVDSSNKYFRLATILKDTIYNAEKLKSIEGINFKEQIRQKQLAENQLQVQEERKKNIQYALIALGIVTFVILFFLLSRSIIVNERWISFFGILGLLIVFEFINLLLHPFLERITHHNPILMLLTLVALASMLIPFHHRLEKWIKEKMTEKNKKIRLASAKKTIEELEKKRDNV